MGRLPYLTRLALGRSAFSPVTSNDPSEPYTDLLTGQTYDAAGRPFNAAVRTRTEALVRAKNEVLLAVGVTELSRRQRDDEPSATKSTGGTGGLSPIDLDELEEDDIGDEAFLFADLAHMGLTWWVDKLRRRWQAGVIPAEIPFSSVLAYEWLSFRKGSVTCRYHYLTAGLGVDLLGNLLADIASDTVEVSASYLKDRITNAEDLSSKAKQLLVGVVNCATVVAQITFEFAVISVTIESLLQQFGKEGNWILPTIKSLVPWQRNPAHVWIWQTGSSILPKSELLLNIAFSPGALCFAYHKLTTWIHDSGNFMQEYGEQPAILSPTSQEDFQQNKSAAIKKRTPFLLKPLVFLRDEMLDLTRWSYWSYFATPSLGIRRAQSLSAILALEDGGRLAPLRGSFQPGIDPDVISARRRARRMHLEPGKPRNEVEGWPCFRTTALSMLPSELLGHRLNELTWKIIKAPLNILLCRSVLFAYRSQSSDTMVRNKSGFAVVSRGFLETLKDEKWGLIVGKIGLCVALEATISTVVWTGAYWFASSFRARESRRRNP